MYGCNNYGYNPCCGSSQGLGSGYALILVLFILLVIIGSTWYATR